MSYDEEKFMSQYQGMMASDCDAQLPVFARVGRGLRGDSFRIDQSIEDNQSILTGIITDYSEGAEHEAWKMSISDFAPMLYYRLYEGVREIDGERYNGWYLRLKYQVKAAAFPLFDFETPFTPTSKNNETGPLPADVITSSNF